MTQAELQQDLERFATRLMDACAEAVVPLTKTDTKTREVAVRQVVRYGSSVVDIASGPAPEINLLDMIVFVRLSHHVLDDYWVPKVFGDKGLALARAFADWEENRGRAHRRRSQRLRSLVGGAHGAHATSGLPSKEVRRLWRASTLGRQI